MKTTIKRVSIPLNKRIIAISDIHGHYEHLKSLLNKVNFNKDDILFIIGDIIEKGPMSLKTIRFVMELQEKYEVYVLIGNVDAVRLALIEDVSEDSVKKHLQYIKYMKDSFGSCFFLDMCEELKLTVKTLSQVREASIEIMAKFKRELDFIRKLPTIIETEKYIFVHGGIPSSDLNVLEGTDAMPYLKNNAFIEKGIYFSKYIVVGHWPVTLYNDRFISYNPIINKEQKIISIDGGCGLKIDGQLNALIISNDNITFEAYDKLPYGFALDMQEASEDSINIRYIDNEICVLEEENEFSLVLHKSSGRKLWILNEYIYGSKCEDFTDYKLKVAVGDKLSIVKETSKGYIVKNKGVTGWYKGNIRK